MFDFNRGIKTGALSGFVFGIGLSILNSLSYPYFNPAFLVLSALITSIYFAIPGVFFGMLFIKFYDKLPAEGVLPKSIILSVYSWLAIFMFFAMLLSTSSSSSMFYIYQALVYLLIVFIIFGICYSLIFERIKPTSVLRERYIKRCPNCGRVIQEDYKKCPYCAATL